MSTETDVGARTGVDEAVVPGYDVGLECRATLADRREVFIRPIRPQDARALGQALAAADPETLHARFLGAAPHGEAAIRGLVELDYVHRLALIAFAADGTGVGIARYEGKAGHDAAEVAVAVDPGWRQLGLGSLLLRRLGAAALSRGIRRFTALVLSDNASVLAVLQASGLAYSTHVEGGTSEIVMSLDAPIRPGGA